MSTTPQGKKKTLKKIKYNEKLYEIRKKIKESQGKLMPGFLLNDKRKIDR